jgi:hypothetical protein
MPSGETRNPKVSIAFAVVSMVATWSGDNAFDLEAAANRGWKAVLEGWRTTAEATRQDKNGPDLADQIAGLTPEGSGSKR